MGRVLCSKTYNLVVLNPPPYSLSLSYLIYYRSFYLEEGKKRSVTIKQVTHRLRP